MKYFDFLNQIQRRLQSINQFEHEYLITDFLCPTKRQNALVVREAGEDAELLVCIDEEILEKNSHLRLPHDFELKDLPELSIVIEELSHFNTFCSGALMNRPLSQLELEIQGEVDKFAVVLDWLHERNESIMRDQIYDLMFGSCRLGEWVNQQDRSRYEEAHEIAKNFIRSVLLKSKTHEECRASFRHFFFRTRSEKLRTSF
jgi:hypothetical protein